MDLRFDFAEKNCVVTGGASGMGREIAATAAAAGAAVYVADRNLQGAQELAGELTAKGFKAHAVYLDGTDMESVQAAAHEVAERAGQIHFLVNSMGIGAKAREGESFDAVFNRVLNVNLHGIFNSCCAFGEAMIQTGGGSIVNIASQAATIVPAKTRPGRGGEYGLLGYCTSKAGVKHLTRAMGALWADYGIRANSVSPGYVDTPLTAEPHSDPVIRAGMLEKVPLKKIAQPQDIVGTVLFLLSDASSYITAQDVIIDGGYTAL